jgi:hypothetical protein
MGSQMSSQIEIETELFIAKCALKWFLSCVHQLMTLEFRVVQKPLVTAVNRANVLSLAVRHHVFAQTGGVLEQFGTPKHIAGVYAALLIAYVN